MPRTLRDSQRELRENFILDTAYQLLQEQGYAGMSMDELAAKVGIAKMTLYKHFASKEALAVGVIVRGMSLVESDLHDTLNASQPAIERLRTLIVKGLERRSSIARINLELAAQHDLE